MAEGLLGQAMRTVSEDGALLRRFADEGDHAAFEVLMSRHGPMVWGVCRRVLAHADADDAFQATFLVLVRNAARIVKRSSLAAWLHGVARRVAVRARSTERDRKQREASLPSPSPTEADLPDGLRELLDEELSRLPEKYRAPLVLCYLEGKTNDEAAELLGWTRGTVAGRMSRAREILRLRLERRGLSMPAALPLVAVPAALVSTTLKTVAAGAAVAGPVAALANGAFDTMSTMKILIAGAVLALAAGAGLAWYAAKPEEKAKPKPVAATKADREAVVKGGNAFAFDLFHKLRAKEKGNLFLSPFSVSSALAMARAGAKGDTAAEMSAVLGLSLPDERSHAAMGSLQRDLDGGEKKRKYALSIANSFWGQKGHPFRDSFLELNKTHYAAGLYETDFASAAEASRKEINKWVEEKTKEKVKEVIPPGGLTRATRFAIANAIHFKGGWLKPFEKKWTRIDDFHLAGGKKAKVPLMIQSGEFAFASGEGFRAIELPYAGKEVSMVVIAPDEADGLPAIEKAMTAELAAKTIAGMMPVPSAMIVLPRFKMAWAGRLNDALGGLGMKKAFGPGADFSGMSGSENLYLGPVFHKAVIEVNEEGTEAAAATIIGGEGGLPPIVKADRPFLFLIRDTRSGAILFLGRVMDPR